MGLSWKAVRKGEIYCAPACGRGCTHDEFRNAQHMGAALAKELGSRWLPFVWENLGWHFKAVSPCARICVHPSYFGANSFLAFLGKANDGGGNWSEFGTTPKKAVEATFKAAEADLAGFGAKLMWKPFV